LFRILHFILLYPKHIVCFLNLPFKQRRYISGRLSKTLGIDKSGDVHVSLHVEIRHSELNIVSNLQLFKSTERKTE